MLLPVKSGPTFPQSKDLLNNVYLVKQGVGQLRIFVKKTLKMGRSTRRKCSFRSPSSICFTCDS